MRSRKRKPITAIIQWKGEEERPDKHSAPQIPFIQFSYTFLARVYFGLSPFFLVYYVLPALFIS